MSVLVDTSVWIRFLANKAPFAAELDRLLADDAVAGHEFVYGELLVGTASAGRSCWTATNGWSRFRQCLTATSWHS